MSPNLVDSEEIRREFGPKADPVLMTFHFQALNLDGIGHAVAVLRHLASPVDIVHLVKLKHVCHGRRCTLHRGTPGKRWGEPITTGECIKLVIPPLRGRSDAELHWRLGSVVPIFDDIAEPPAPVISMLIEDQPPFIQALYDT